MLFALYCTQMAKYMVIHASALRKTNPLAGYPLCSTLYITIFSILYNIMFSKVLRRESVQFIVIIG